MEAMNLRKGVGTWEGLEEKGKWHNYILIFKKYFKKTQRDTSSTYKTKQKNELTDKKGKKIIHIDTHRK